jgi:hypothetical protein
VRVEELQAEADRILAELSEAETVLERRVIARVELAEALSAPDDAGGVPAPDPEEEPPVMPVSPVAVSKTPVAGSIVPRRREGLDLKALAPDYRRIVEMLEFEPAVGQEGLSAKEMAARLGLELVPAKIEGVRSRAKRLVERDWLVQLPSGRFTPRGLGATG